MKYTVVWGNRAKNRLAAIWTEASDRGDVTRAANAIDQFLANNADWAGISRDDVTRVLVARPLFVVYEILPEDYIVRVLIVGRSDRL